MINILSIVTSIQKQCALNPVFFDPKLKSYKTVLLGNWNQVIQNNNVICTIGYATQNDEIGS